MNFNTIVLFAVAALATATTGLAQSPSAEPVSSDLTMPYKSNFWRYVGGDIGQARHYPFCWISPDDCQSNSETAKLFIGGKFNEAMGLEIGYVDTGKIHV